MSFLHGLEVVESASGLSEVKVNSTSVIGVIGTAPGADVDLYPLNTPVLVSGSLANVTGLGEDGTIPSALKGIFDQCSAKVVIVRVEQSVNENAEEGASETLANVIGSEAGGVYTGMHAFVCAQSLLGYTPKVLIAPGFSNDVSVATELLTIANRLKAVVVADAPNSQEEAVTYASTEALASDRMYVVYPYVVIANNIEVAASPYVAGVIAKTDSEVGFWASPSNKQIAGIIGLSNAVDYSHGDASCVANVLNEANVTTIVNYDGYRLWGNRTTAGAASKIKFLCVRRTADAINEAVLNSHLWAVDRNIVKNYLTEVVESVNAFLRDLKARGAILHGECKVNKELTTSENVMAGKVYFDFEFTPAYCAEHVTFTSYLNNDKIEEVLFENLAI